MQPGAMRHSAPAEVKSMPTWVGTSSNSEIARRGQGRSGGYRAIVLFRRGERSFFVYGFAKSAATIFVGTSWRRSG